MNSWDEIMVKTHHNAEFVDITSELVQSLKRSGINDGFGVVFVAHTTAGLTINENADPDVVDDLLMALDKVVPASLPYKHREGNSPAHLKSSFMGFERMIPVREGRLALGTWQGVYLCEFDGPRTRRVMVRWQG